MPDSKLSALTELAVAPATTDEVYIRDVSEAAADQSKRITIANLVAASYPVGAVFIAVVATSPATLFGFGTWSAIGTGRVLVGIDSADVDFDTVEETGGAKTSTPSAHAGSAVAAHVVTQPANHVFTQPDAHTDHADNIAHTHTQRYFPTATGGSIGYTVDTSMSGTQTNATLTTASSGTGAALAHSAHAGGAVDAHSGTAVDAHVVTQPSAHAALSVVQPYLVVYMWKRTA